MNVFRGTIAGLCCSVLCVASPTIASAASAPKSELDKAIGRCVMAVGVGALLGAAIGNNSGRGNAGRGALVGAAAGGAVCVVLMKVAKDKDAILARQRQAVELGGFQTANFQGKEGPVLVSTTVRDAPPPAGDQTKICRYADSTIMVPDGGEATLGSQLYCRNGAGDWMIAQASGVAAG